MKRFTFIVTLMLACIGMNGVCAKEKAESYNLSRAQELFGQEEYEKGVEYLIREIADNPKCGKAYEMLAYYYGSHNENGEALSVVDLALKYTPKKDKGSRAYSHYIRGKVYLQMLDTVQAIPDYKQAIQLDPEEISYREDLANIYFYTRNYREADEVYNDMAKKNPGLASPFFGLSRTAYTEERFDDARALLAKARLLSPTDPMSDRIEMRIDFKENKYNEALGKALKLLSEDFYDTEAFITLRVLSDSIYTQTINALTKKAFEDKPNRENWDLIKAFMLKRHKDYALAIKCLIPIAKSNSDLKATAMIYLIECYENLDDMEQMERVANLYLELYPEDSNALIKRADARFFAGKYDESATDFQKAMDIEPGYGSFCNYRLGWIEEMKKNYEAALEHYNTAIALDESYPYTYMMKGFLLKDYLNRPEEATEAFRLCIEKDSIMEEGTAMQYAYAGLGERDKAIEVMDSILSLNPDNAGNYYDAACMYSRLKEKENALKHLKIAFEKGYTKFRHVENDDDMDFIRDTPEFKALIEEFDKKDTESGNQDASQIETMTYEIPLVRQTGGSYLVKASINGLPMDFILDTGCSDVSISQVESDFMFKNGYLSKSDMKGERRYADAGGNINKAQTVNLSTVKLGNLEVTNIRAGIVPNQKAPLLLGQEVLNRFGKVEIDTVRNLLKITVNK